MRFLDWLLGTQQVYRKYAGVIIVPVVLLILSILSISFFVAATVSKLLPASVDDFEPTGLTVVVAFLLATLIGLAVIVRIMVRLIVVDYRFRDRRYRGRIDLKNPEPAGSRIGVSILREEFISHKGQSLKDSLRTQIITKGHSWWLYDAKSSRPNLGSAGWEWCYTVFEAKLRQPTPHLFFDGLRANRRQIQAIYSGAQQLRGILGGKLDRQFTVYAPLHHQIETLSFITPEVVEAMLLLTDYDVEFVDNSLFCYAPLLRSSQLDSFQKLGINLYARVNDNLRLYVPEKSKTKPFGRRLLKNHRPKLMGASAVVLLGILMVVMAIGSSGTHGFARAQLGFYGVLAGIIGAAAWLSGQKLKRQNQRLERKFLRS